MRFRLPVLPFVKVLSAVRPFPWTAGDRHRRFASVHVIAGSNLLTWVGAGPEHFFIQRLDQRWKYFRVSPPSSTVDRRPPQMEAHAVYGRERSCMAESIPGCRIDAVFTHLSTRYIVLCTPNDHFTYRST